MTAKTVYTCDHCGDELPPYIGRQWRASFLTIGEPMDSVFGCSREHLGLALAKVFELPIDGNTLRLVTEKNEACAEVDRLEKELRDRPAPPLDATGKTPGQVLRAAFRSAPGEMDCDDKHEFGASTVLAAFGPLVAADALNRLRDDVYKIEYEWVTLKGQTVPTRVVEVGNVIDTIDEFKIASLTYPGKPTKPEAS